MINIKVLNILGDNIQITDGTSQTTVSRKLLDEKINEGLINVDNIKIRCINKERDKNNNIIAYRIQDLSGKQMDVTPEQLKRAIFNYQVDCTNLRLTSNNRLIDSDNYLNNHIESKNTNVDSETKLDKAVELKEKIWDGPIPVNVKEEKTNNKLTYTIVSLLNNETIVVSLDTFDKLKSDIYYSGITTANSNSRNFKFLPTNKELLTAIEKMAKYAEEGKEQIINRLDIIILKSVDYNRAVASFSTVHLCNRLYRYNKKLCIILNANEKYYLPLDSKDLFKNTGIQEINVSCYATCTEEIILSELTRKIDINTLKILSNGLCKYINIQHCVENYTDELQDNLKNNSIEDITCINYTMDGSLYKLLEYKNLTEVSLDTKDKLNKKSHKLHNKYFLLALIIKDNTIYKAVTAIHFMLNSRDDAYDDTEVFLSTDIIDADELKYGIKNNTIMNINGEYRKIITIPYEEYENSNIVYCALNEEYLKNRVLIDDNTFNLRLSKEDITRFNLMRHTRFLLNSDKLLVLYRRGYRVYNKNELKSTIIGNINIHEEINTKLISKLENIMIKSKALAKEPNYSKINIMEWTGKNIVLFKIHNLTIKDLLSEEYNIVVKSINHRNNSRHSVELWYKGHFYAYLYITKQKGKIHKQEDISATNYICYNHNNGDLYILIESNHFSIVLPIIDVINSCNRYK